MPTPEEIDRMKRLKKTLTARVPELDIYTKFKMECIRRSLYLKQGLDQAIKLWLKTGR